MKVGSRQWRQLIVDGGAELGVSVESGHVDLFAVHAEELLFWNRKTNLTAITDPAEIAVKHFLDSIAAIPLIPEKGRLLDLGSGGGFPGIPIKILRPSLHVTLVDASRKKIHFLKNLIRKAGLNMIDAIQSRTELLAASEPYQGCFEIVTARAFTDFERFVGEAVPFLSKNGMIIAYVGKNEEKGREAIKLLFYKKWKQITGKGADGRKIHVDIKKIQLPVYDVQRNFVTIKI
jgi:16S rRNA (guanine527-N7)-methyltransferase